MKRAALVVLILLVGCNLAGPEEKAIGEMVGTFVAAIHRNDRDLAFACLLDMKSFKVLNPDASARLDAEDFTENAISDLVSEFQKLVNHFQGHDLKVTKFILGTPWYQYTGHSAFVGSEVIVSVDGDEVTIPIRGIVRIGDQWRIVDLSGIDLY